MAKKYYDVDDDTYYDGEDKNPKILRIILFFILLIIIIILVLSSCNKTSKSSNNYLSSITFSHGELSPSFDKNVSNYDLKVSKDSFSITCIKESVKSSITGCNERISIHEGEKLTKKVTVTAENGSSRTYTINIYMDSEVVEEKHEVKISSLTANGEASSKDVILEAVVTPNNYSYTYAWYKDSVLIENATSNKYIAKESGTYRVEVTNTLTDEYSSSDDYKVIINKEEKKETTDDNGNNNSSSKYTLKINSVTGIPTSWVKSATIKVNATASNGLASKSYSFDGGKTFIASNTITVNSNKNINIIVKDSKGNTVNKSISITKIDSTVPKVSISSSSSSSVYTLTATVNPSSNPSGYTYTWYKDNKVINGATSKTYKTSDIGTYKVILKTKAGNYGSDTYKITGNTNLTCPTLKVSTESGKYIEQRTWTTENVKITITPQKGTVFYDVYVNQKNNMDSISQVYSYLNTSSSVSSVIIRDKGMRVVKMVINDGFGNTKDCYSKAYYLK